MAAPQADTITQGLKTIHLRYPRMEENAKQVVEFLQGQKEVSAVFYPGLDPRFPFGGQMNGPGYMVAFTLEGGLEAGKVFQNSLRVPTRAVSLGSVESLVSHSASTTHATVPAEEREQLGILDGLVRLSVGIEYIGDIIKDLEAALRKVAGI
ncbi:Cys/Met metabolism PLP-dependent enzyme [Candidatus Burarchaeum australiense]|nr:Cys/Met metabolism PLP-dependent enzyme [Candidatus Burarchaeum australiense]